MDDAMHDTDSSIYDNTRKKQKLKSQNVGFYYTILVAAVVVKITTERGVFHVDLYYTQTKKGGTVFIFVPGYNMRNHTKFPFWGGTCLSSNHT
jgi:hypothetical protein